MEMMTSNELKNSLVELLCDFDLFARKNNLRYSLAYGTLLGSIRHQGFIPWMMILIYGCPGRISNAC